MVCGRLVWDDAAAVKHYQTCVIPLHSCCFLYYTHELLRFFAVLACGTLSCLVSYWQILLDEHGVVWLKLHARF